MRRGVSVVLAVLLLLSPASARPVAAAADHLFFTVNPAASIASGTLFNVQVVARDSSLGNAVDAGFTGNVTLTAAAVGGSNFTAGNVVAATNGVASFNVFLNNAANTYQITASAAGLTDGLSSTFNVTATHLAILAIGNVQAGTPFNVTVQGRDADNNVAENFSGNVDVNASATGGSNFNGGQASVAAVGGSATFVGLVLNDAADGYTATAASPGLTGAVSNAFNVTVAVPAADHLFFTVNPAASIASGTLFNVQVVARDSSLGNAVDAGFTGNVTLTAAAVGGSNFTAGNVVAATNGVASFNVFLNNAANTYQITASAAGLTDGLSSTFNVTATHLAILAISNVQAGTPFNVTVQGRDADNNVAENFSGNVDVNASATGGSNFNGGQASVAAVGGSATFVGLVLNDAADGYTATAASPGLTGAVSNAFNVTVAVPAADHLFFTVNPAASIASGTLFNVQVVARDSSLGNAVDAGFTGNVTLTAAAVGGSNFTAGNVVAATNGVASFNVFLNNAANTYQITASAAGLTDGLSNSFNVTATHLAILAIGNVRAGDPFNVTVQGRDADNNVAENFAGNVDVNASATGGSNFNGGTANVAAVGGSATFVGLVLNDAADGYTATAASPGLTGAVSNAFNVTARQLVITTVVPNHQAGTPLAVTVEARDANNSVAENFSGTVSLNAAATGGSNFVGGTKNVVAVAGVATFPGLVLNDAADNYSITASSPGLTDGLSNSFNVTATHLAILAIGNVRAGDPFNVTVQGRDANNNVAENFAGNVNLDAAATGGSNFNGGTANVAAVGGSATFVGLVLNDAADGYTATAASPGLTSGVSNAFNVTARQLVITTVVPNHQAGTPLAVTVEARDANNSVAENFSGTVSLNAAATGGSNFVGGTKNVVAVAGVATFPGLVLNDAADNYSITASSPGLTDGLSNSFNVTATHLAILAIGNVRAGDPFNVTVQGRDANNNVAENFAGNVNLDAAATGGSNFNGGTANVAAVGGSATFVGLVLNDAADGYTATAASPGLTSGVSNAFNVTARQLVITTVVPNHQAGTPLAVTVEARDANNSVAENFSGTVSLNAAATGGSNFVGGTKNVVAVAGVATFPGLVLNDAADNYSITASSPGLTDGLSNSFNVTEHPNLFIGDVSITEGNVGTKIATFTVSLSRPGAHEVTVSFATSGASATSGTDFVATSGILTFDVGQTSKTITVAVKGDLLNEADETFHVNLSGAVNAFLVDAQGTGTIRNDDPVPVIVALPEAAVEGSTAPRTATVKVKLLAPSGQEVRVGFRTVDGTAVDGVGEGGSDYTPTSGTLVFAPGQVERTVTVALRNDLVVEADEFCFVHLSSPVNAAILTPLAALTILDDDAPSRQLAALKAQVLALDLAPAKKATLLDNLRLHCGSLREFTRDVARWRGTFIAPADADALIAAANRLRADIGCAP